MKNKLAFYLLPIVLFFTESAWSMPLIPLLTNSTKAGESTYSGTINILILMTLLILLPALLMTMTCFMRIIIVLSLLRHALGIAQTPSNQILIGVALFMTFFIMSPVLNTIQKQGVNPYFDQKITLNQALDKAGKPLHEFMLNQTRKDDLNFFIELSGKFSITTRDAIPFTILIPSYITSELQTAFQIGFLLFIPFLIIDLIVSSTLMAMGMMMVSPMIISLPLKIMLFVMVNGWHLVFETLANSFYR